MGRKRLNEIIEKNKTYNIKPNIYFVNKYGHDLTINIEDKADIVFGHGWERELIPAVVVYMQRIGFNNFRGPNNCWYGKINGIGEIITIDDLEYTIFRNMNNDAECTYKIQQPYD